MTQTLSASPPAYQPVVLVIDDEPMVVTFLRIFLTQLGYAVRTANGPQDGIDVFQREHADIDLVLLDVRMPGLDGPDVLRVLRQFDPEVLCCFMSGDFGKYTLGSLTALGAQHIFRKPFRLEELEQTLATLFQQQLLLRA
jgi:CheY-like chemotaxis protein